MIPFTAAFLRRNGRINILTPQEAGFSPLPNNGFFLNLCSKKDMGEMRGDGGEKVEESRLLDRLLMVERSSITGPFLTVQRRRRRRKFVRTFMFKDPTLIDDLSPSQTNLVLGRINQWAFNAFILDNVTGGRPLPNLCVHLFKEYGLLEEFNLDPVIVWKLFSIIEDGYHWRNPYHNAVHAADVTQAMHCFLQEKFILESLLPIEILSAIVAAVTHDLDHPGVNQPFLVATSNHLAALYKNSSVLENHHWRSAMGCLNESGVSDVLGPARTLEVEEQIRSLVLATDITRQQEFLTSLKEYLDTDTLDMGRAEVRHFVLQIALKCADICNPCRPWDISKKWSMKVCEEFFRQGDYERQLALPVTSTCDRYKTSVPKIQTGFFDYVVLPLFKEWNRMLQTPLSRVMMDNLTANKRMWDQLLVDEAARVELAEMPPQHLIEDAESPSLNAAFLKAKARSERRSVRFDTKTSSSDAGWTLTSASDEDEEEDPSPADPKRPHLLPPSADHHSIPRPDGRRHSIATGLIGSHIHVPPTLLINSRVVGRTVVRRESLPGGIGIPKPLPSRTILHLERVGGESGSGESSSPSAPSSPASRLTRLESCLGSGSEELIDFPPTTELDSLCPHTSILSMSPSVAHSSLTQSAELEDQRRHLIRQQTCPVVSLSDANNPFSRPRFLSAAAALSPTTLSASQIISQHRMRKSPEGEERSGSGSSSEALHVCAVIDEEDRQSEGETSPLEIYVHQFPPPDDNEGEPPRRGSGASTTLDSATQTEPTTSSKRPLWRSLTDEEEFEWPSNRKAGDMGTRGGQDRRSDPTQYHSEGAKGRRASAPTDLLRQSFRGKCGRTGRRGSLPSASEGPLCLIQLVPWGGELKRGSSGGPELFAAAKVAPVKGILIEEPFWSRTVRRGSLPVEAIFGTGSCSSESDSSGGDSSDT